MDAAQNSIAQLDIERYVGIGNRTDLYGVADQSIKAFINRELGDANAAESFIWRQTNHQRDLYPLKEEWTGVVHLARINDIRRVNKFLEEVNRNMPNGKWLVVCVETKDSRRTRILNKFPRYISRPYYGLDFILKRVLPKWKPTRKIYFWITKGRNRVISYTEAIGRLFSCGFEVKNSVRIGYKTYILARKTGDPSYDMQPTYGALVRLRRVGYKGERIKLYKLRTMHPYSEYVQEYIYDKHGTDDGDKANDDFRVTGWGELFRKVWIDELPMFWNYFKRDLKLVGVRPLSEHKFSTYPEYLQKKRTSVKPGLLPPYYADMPETPEEFYDSEERYLDAYLKNPIKTDVKYFFKILYNIVIKRERSA